MKNKVIFVTRIGLVSYDNMYVEKILKENSKNNGYIVNEKFYSNLKAITKEYGKIRKFTCNFGIMERNSI
jgi:hypothetical protein